MPTSRPTIAATALVSLALSSHALAQSASTLYTWDGTPGTNGWVKKFGTNNLTLTNANPGELTFAETGTPGSTFALGDDGNRVRESSTAASGGLDLTGLSFLEFEIGHTGTAPINTQFYLQSTPLNTFLALGPDVAVLPGVNIYRVPLTGLTDVQRVYSRTIGINVRDHAAQGNLTWTLREIRSGGTPLTQRDLVTFNDTSIDNGLQGAVVNFDKAAVQGNPNGSLDQAGLSRNAAGSGSLQWTDLGNTAGGAISWGNGTSVVGTSGTANTFNNRTTDMSNYATMTVTLSALDAANPTGTLDVQGFLQANGFSFRNLGTQAIPTDGLYHDLVFSLAGFANLDVVEQSGVNIAPHATDLLINIDNVRLSAAPPAIPGDYNADGTVNAADYTVWADNFGQTGPNLPGDGNNDGTVNAADYTVWADNFGQGTPPAGAIPEPAAFAFTIPALALLRRRRQHA